jgi:membrane protein implicated in regulation of membrane protease activity
MLMLTPLSYSYLFAWLILPFAVITERARHGGTILWWGIAAYAVFLLALPSPRMVQAYGNFFAGALILFLGLALELMSLTRRKRE